jgi:rubrerythrin
MSAKHWTLDDLPWDRFDPSKVDPDTLKVMKAAALVEYNGGDYASYLCNVFPDDAEFCAEARRWAREEVQHGEALGRWAQMADPDFDFDAAFQRFLDGFRLPLDAKESVRGSRSGELVARCIVEVGTSSFYGSIGDTTDEPVLKEICKRIAADELRHYKLFYRFLRRYLESENISKARRVAIALGRINETEDDELACAYWAANSAPDAPYEHRKWCEAYMSRAFGYYRLPRIERATAMTWKAAGLDPQSRAVGWFATLAWRLMQYRKGRLEKAGALAA